MQKSIRCDKKYPEKCEICNYEPKNNKSYIEHKLLYHSTIDERKTIINFFAKNAIMEQRRKFYTIII